MENSDLIVSLIERIEKLEKQVGILQSEKKVPIVNEETFVQKEYTRNEARQYAMKQFVKHNPEFSAIKAKRHEGSGIVLIHDTSETVFKVKFYHSNNHRDDRLFGWHKISNEHVEEGYDFYVFTVNFSGKIYPFILSRL